jgi:hypothetical protein
MSINDPNLIKQIQNTGNPDLNLALEIAQSIRDDMQKMETQVAEQIRTAINMNAQTVKRIEDMEKAFGDLKQDLQNTRAERADKELREAEARYMIAKQQKDGLSTQEKIEVGKAMDERLSAVERARVEKRRAFWDKVFPSVTTALIISVVAPVGLAFFIAVLVFILRALGIEVQLPGAVP